jgi:hypothetical protein
MQTDRKARWVVIKYNFIYATLFLIFKLLKNLLYRVGVV